jgi:hypothetical protein
MLLKGYFPLGDLGEIAKGFAFEFAIGDHGVPLFAAYLSFIGLDTIEVESKVSFILNQPDLVPFSHGFGFGDRGVP